MITNDYTRLVKDRGEYPGPFEKTKEDGVRHNLNEYLEEQAHRQTPKSSTHHTTTKYLQAEKKETQNDAAPAW